MAEIIGRGRPGRGRSLVGEVSLLMESLGPSSVRFIVNIPSTIAYTSWYPFFYGQLRVEGVVGEMKPSSLLYSLQVIG